MAAQCRGARAGRGPSSSGFPGALEDLQALADLGLGEPAAGVVSDPDQAIVSHRESFQIGPRRQGSASRPGLLRADPKGWLFMREKRGGGPWGARASC